MSTFTRSIRNVLDSFLDLSNGTVESLGTSGPAGWTTQIAAHFINTSSPTVALTEYNNVEDSTGAYPELDGVVIVGNTATVPSYPSNVGLRHYHHQMQAMKGINNNFTTGASSMGGDDPSPIGGTASSSLGISQVSDGGGTYKNNDIQMGHMRGFQYHQNSNAIWSFSTGTGATTEHTLNVGPIRVGDGT